VTRYRTIVADPPWPYAQGNVRGSRQKTLTDRLSKGVSSVERYGSMSIAALCAITPPAETDAHLWLWTTNAFMAEAHDLAQAWGFAPKTIGTWGKVQPNGEPSRKVGYYLRGATEHCILAVRGSLAFKTSRAYATLWLWPRLPHSVKPDAFYDMVEDCSPGPYLELFARRQRLGWDTWGDEALEHVQLAAEEPA
jgi:N6-adenosine-specific RNA methylase IME4